MRRQSVIRWFIVLFLLIPVVACKSSESAFGGKTLVDIPAVFSQNVSRVDELLGKAISVSTPSEEILWMNPNALPYRKYSLRGMVISLYYDSEGSPVEIIVTLTGEKIPAGELLRSCGISTGDEGDYSIEFIGADSETPTDNNKVNGVKLGKIR